MMNAVFVLYFCTLLPAGECKRVVESPKLVVQPSDGNQEDLNSVLDLSAENAQRPDPFRDALTAEKPKLNHVSRPEQLAQTIEEKVKKLVAKLEHIAHPAKKTLVTRPYCSFTCPISWSRAVYLMWSTRYHTKKLAAAVSGGAAQVPLLAIDQYDHNLATSLSNGLTDAMKLMIETIDNNLMMRVSMTLLLGPSSLLRKISKGWTGTRMCQFKPVFDSMVADGYKRNNWAIGWWKRVFFGGCNFDEATGASVEDVHPVQDDSSDFDSVVQGLVLNGETTDQTPDGDEGDLEPDEVQLRQDIWANVPDWPPNSEKGHCMVIFKKHQWHQKFVYISNGIVYWRRPTSSSECRNVAGSKAPNRLQKLRSNLGKLKSLSLRLATSVQDMSRAQITEEPPPEGTPYCLKINTSFQAFLFCFEGNLWRTHFGTAVKQHMSVGRSADDDIFDVAAKVQRLTALSLSSESESMLDKENQAEIKALKDAVILEGPSAGETVDAIGDMSAASVTKTVQDEILATLPGDSNQFRRAAVILERFRNGTKLLQQAQTPQGPVGEEGPATFIQMQEAVAEGQRMMHQALLDAHSHEALSHWMHGAGSSGTGNLQVANAIIDLPLWAQILIILFLCLTCTGLCAALNNGR